LAVLRKYILLLFSIGLCAFTFSAASGQGNLPQQVPEPKVTLIADKQEIRVGEQVAITLSVAYPADYRVVAGNAYPDVEGLERLSADKVGIVVTDQGRTEETTRTFKAITEGKFVINPIKVTFSAPNEKTVDVQSNGLAIVVLKSDTPEEGLHDIKGLKPIKTPSKWLLFLTIGTVAIALILLVLVFMGRKPRLASGVSTAWRNIEEEYVSKLKGLAIPEEYDAQAVKKIYLLMSEIVRTYLAERWKVEAREETTVEVLNEMKKAGFGKHILEGYEILGRAFDMVKYAKGRPFADDIEKARQAAIDFIRLMAALGDKRETESQ